MNRIWKTKTSQSFEDPQLHLRMETQQVASDQRELLSGIDISSDEENLFDIGAVAVRNQNEANFDATLPYSVTTEPVENSYSRFSKVFDIFKPMCSLGFTIEPVILLYFMGTLMTVPLTQQLLYAIISARMNFSISPVSLHNSSQCKNNENGTALPLEQEVQATTSFWMMVFVVTSVVPAFFTTVFLGAYSDKAGRKIGIIVPIIGAGLRALWSVIVLFAGWPVATLLLGVLVDGMSGGIGTMTMSCFAYISDVTTISQRSLRIVIVEIAISVGITLSAVTAGYLIIYISFKYAFVIVLAIYVTIALYALLLPETVLEDPQASFFTTKHFKAVYYLYECDDNKRRWKLITAMTLLFLICISEFGAGDVLTLTFLSSPLCWSSIQIGYFFAASCAIRSTGSIVTTKLLSQWTSDEAIITMAFISALIYNLILALAKNTAQLYAAPVGGVFSLLAMPMIRAFASKRVLPKEQGILFGSIAWMQLLSVLVGNLSFNAIYAQTLALIHGFVFYIISAVLLLAVGISLFLNYWIRREYRQHEGHLTYVDVHDTSVN